MYLLAGLKDTCTQDMSRQFIVLKYLKCNQSNSAKENVLQTTCSKITLRFLLYPDCEGAIN